MLLIVSVLFHLHVFLVMLGQFCGCRIWENLYETFFACELYTTMCLCAMYRDYDTVRFVQFLLGREAIYSAFTILYVVSLEFIPKKKELPL